MKAEELMIGDYARVCGEGLLIKKGTIVKILGVDGENTFEELKGSASCMPLDRHQFNSGIWVKYLEPIPLTPEILEKNGFDHMSNSNYDYDDGYGCLIRYNTWDRQLKILRNLDVVYDSGECSDMAVHQLQHALRLCGIDKEIVL